MTTQEPNPALIFETLNAHQQSASLRAAIELDLFTTIAQGAASAPEIAAQTNASERGARILCDYLTVIGFLTKDGTAYGLTPISEVFLNTQSPAYLGSVARFINSDDLLTAFHDVTTLVREGTTQLSDDGSVTDEWEGWVEFAHAMAPMMAPAAEFIGELAVEGASGKAARSRHRRRARPVRNRRCPREPRSRDHRAGLGQGPHGRRGKRRISGRRRPLPSTTGQRF